MALLHSRSLIYDNTCRSRKPLTPSLPQQLQRDRRRNPADAAGRRGTGKTGTMAPGGTPSALLYRSQRVSRENGRSLGATWAVLGVFTHWSHAQVLPEDGPGPQGSAGAPGDTALHEEPHCPPPHCIRKIRSGGPEKLCLPLSLPLQRPGLISPRAYTPALPPSPGAFIQSLNKMQMALSIGPGARTPLCRLCSPWDTDASLHAGSGAPPPMSVIADSCMK